MRRLLIAITLAVMSSGYAHAESDIELISKALQACKNKETDKDRLGCFELVTKAANNLANLNESAAEKSGTSAENTTQNETPDYKVVDSADLYVAPGKYLNRPVEVQNMKCFYADKDEYRCLGSGNTLVLVLSPDITPAAEKAKLENDCDTVKNVSSQKCRRTLRFTPLEVNEDTVSGYIKRKIFTTKSAEVLPVNKRK